MPSVVFFRVPGRRRHGNLNLGKFSTSLPIRRHVIGTVQNWGQGITSKVSSVSSVRN